MHTVHKSERVAVSYVFEMRAAIQKIIARVLQNKKAKLFLYSLALLELSYKKSLALKI